MARRSIALPPVPDGPDRPTILVRVYPGHPETAAQTLVDDADTLSRLGYRLVSQTFAPGRYADVQVLIALLLCLVGIGFAILLFMAVNPLPGSLIVTYRLDV